MFLSLHAADSPSLHLSRRWQGNCWSPALFPCLMSWGPQLGRSLSSWNSMIPAIILLWNQTNKNCAIPSMNDWACPTVHIHLFATLCVSVCGDNNMCYSILPQNKEYYISSYQHFPPEDQSLLRVLSLHTITLHSLGDPLLFPMKEKTHCLFETTVLSTSKCQWSVKVWMSLSCRYWHLICCLFTFTHSWVHGLWLQTCDNTSVCYLLNALYFCRSTFLQSYYH